MTNAPTSRRLALSTGLEAHVLEWNAELAERGPTVILVHGFLDLAWTWKPTVDAGLSQLHVVAPDMRGHGDSARVGPGGYYHFLDYVADLRALVAALGREQVSLVGHSMGGSICSYYAGAFPESVERLALVEGLGPPEDGVAAPDRVRTWFDGWQAARRREPRSYASIEAAARRLQAHDPLLDDASARFFAEVGTRPSPGGGRVFKHDPLHLTRGAYGYQVEVARQFWARITCPVLFIDGAESALRLAADDAERRRAAFADSRRVVIDGAGHMVPRHRPRELADALASFLGDGQRSTV